MKNFKHILLITLIGLLSFNVSAQNRSSVIKKTVFSSSIDWGEPLILSLNITAPDTVVLPLGVYLGSKALIEWGDGETSIYTGTLSDKTHTYTTTDTFDVSMYILDGFINTTSNTIATKIVNLKQWGGYLSSFSFVGCSNMIITATDIPTFTESNLTNIFSGCSSITTIPNIGLWDVSNVDTFRTAFFNCVNFNDDISSWNVGSNVILKTDALYRTFYNCQNFNSALNDWDVSGIQSLYETFRECRAFNQPLSDWDVSNVTLMQSTFYNCDNFNSDISGWNTSSATIMTSMFQNAAVFNTNISSWNVSNVESLSSMFHTATLFNQYIGDWDVSKVKSMNFMFRDAEDFNQPLSNWVTTSLIDMSFMFFSNSAFNQDISHFNVENVTTMLRMNEGGIIDTANIDLAYNAWSLQAVKSNVGLRFNRPYTIAVSQAARDILTGTYNWSIIDGGGI